MLTREGVHMNSTANMMMATGVLKGFGLDVKHVKTAADSWAVLVK